jgi:hypothetical protein
MTKNQSHGRFVESFGRLHLAQSLHRAGYLCAEPIIDDGIDLVAFSPESKRIATLQMKASSKARYDVKRKYEGKVDLLVCVFYACSADPKTYMVEYAEIVRDLIISNGYDKNPSWTREADAGWGGTINEKSRQNFESWLATPERWRSLLEVQR